MSMRNCLLLSYDAFKVSRVWTRCAAIRALKKS